MARADLLLALAKAAVLADTARARSVVEAIAAEEGRTRHTVLAKQLGQILDEHGHRPTPGDKVRVPGDPSRALFEVLPKRRLDEVALPEAVRSDLQRLIEEQHRSALLRSYNVEPRHRVLLVGPPGNGKTTCAEALATELAIPMLVLRYEQVITSFLGETAARLEAAFDEVRRRRCVLLLDEFDVLGKERGDEHETGEIKRVVSGLLLQLDRLPSHVVFVAATNHAELLDRGAWRRFQLRAELPSPTRRQAVDFLVSHAENIGMPVTRGVAEAVTRKLDPVSYAQLEAFLLDVRRRQVLESAFTPREFRPVVDATLSHWASVLRASNATASREQAVHDKP